MVNERSETENLARKLFRAHKMKLDLVAERPPLSGFHLAVHRLFGEIAGREKPVRLGNCHFTYFGFAKNLASFLPKRWHDELNKIDGAWVGCENWWAGYPLITWIEMRPGDDNALGYLKLYAEVGPVADHKVRKSLIQAIAVAASSKDLSKIRFETDAADKGRRYSRFLRENTIAVIDIQNADEIEKHVLHLLAAFDEAFEAIADVIPTLLK